MAVKGDPRAASERIEKGIERYGDGDLVAAAVEFEEALRLAPEHGRARQYLSWVKDVLAGTRGNGKKKDLDEDAVRAVTDALDSDGDLGRPDESPWDPVPLMPSTTERATPPVGVPPIQYTPAEAAEAVEAAEAAKAVEAAHAASRSTAPPPSTQPPGTILGIAPQREGLLTPVPRSAAAPPATQREDRPDSVTREYARGTPTMRNLPPLDVPELTEEQVAELISLESSLPSTGPSGRSLAADLATTPDLPTERKAAFIEFEADHTPQPQQRPTLPPPRRRDDTNPEANLTLQPLPFASDFDPLEMTPTKARLGPMPPSGYTVLNPLPVDERPELRDARAALAAADDDEHEEVTQNPTNPFIRSKLATYAYGQVPRDEELPPSPTTPSAKLPIADRFAAAKRALNETQAHAALDMADDVVTESGGVDGDACLPYLSLLEKIYDAVIGPLERRPQHGGTVPDLDPRAAFLLSRLDGSMTIDDLLDVSGMPRLEAMRVLALLIRHGAVVTK